MGYAETFEHTADLGLRIFGDDLADLFQSAAAGLFDVIVVNRNVVRDEDTEHVSLAADSIEDLLLQWLNELIFRCETRHRLYGRFEVAIDEEACRLEGNICGEPIDRERHLLDHEVKAATRHGLFVKRSESGWVAELILDI